MSRCKYTNQSFVVVVINASTYALLLLTPCGDRQTDIPSGINLSTGFVQRVLLVVSKHIDNEGEVLEVVDERRIHWNTHLPISMKEYIKFISYV